MKIQPTAAFHTLGCKLNFAETSTLARQLKEAGFQKVELNEGADVVVINTCSVTENANRECRSLVRKALNFNPESFVAVIGCYAQLKPEEIASIDGVDLVLGATEKFNITDYLQDFSKKKNTEIHSCLIDDADTFISSYSLGDRTRAFLKVQDGCDYTCSYCTIPLARGKSRSDSVENILEKAREIGRSGIKEIVLTGVNIGDFGLNLKTGKRESGFLELIQELDEIEEIERFRISSIEPNLLKDEIIEFVAHSKRFVPHFHIPLQSGSDKLLKLMRRRYLSALYTDRVQAIRRLMPDACIGVDVITGFPGEGEKEFLETYQFLNELAVSYLHVFTYSERENTLAIELPEVVPVAERKRRNQMLRILSQKKLAHFYTSQLGTIHKVLFEADQKDGYMHGFTENYVKVNAAYDPSLVNSTRIVRLEDMSQDQTVTCSFVEALADRI